MALRELIADLAPPILLRKAQQVSRRLHGLGWYNFYGSWPRFSDVPVTKVDATDPWAPALDKISQELEAAVPLSCGDSDQFILPLLVFRYSGSLSVLDFGGGAGVGLASIRRFIRPSQLRLLYVLVETPAMCSVVREKIEAHGGKVSEEIPDMLPLPLIANASSSLQYISDYRAAISRIARLQPEIFVVSRTPMTDSPTYACQILNTPRRKMATWVFNRAEFVADMHSLGYRLVFSVVHDVPLTHGGAPSSVMIGSMVFASSTHEPTT